MATTVQANVANQQVTNTSGGVTFNVSTYGDVITGSNADNFAIQDSYINYNTYNETSGGTMLAGVNNALLGFTNSFSAATGITTLSANGHTGVLVGSQGATLNLTGVTLNNVGLRLDQQNQSVTAPQTGLAYKVYTYNDVINGGGNDTFTIADSYNNYNSYNDVSGGTMQAGTNNALLAFSNSLTAADGISTLSANGYTGVQAGSQGAALNTTGITLNGIGISLAQNGQTVTVPQSGLAYTVSTYGDTINAGGGDTFTVVDPYIEYNSYNDVAGGTVQAGTNNALLGFTNSLTAADGISTLSGNGYSGVDVASNGAVLNLTGITLNDVAISVAQSNQTVTAPQTGLSYIISNYGDTLNGGGGDTFTVVDDYNDYNTYNDVAGGQILGGANNAMIGIAGNFSAAANGITKIAGNGYTGVSVGGTGAVLDLSGVTLSNVTIDANQTTAQTITSTAVGNSWSVSGSNATLNGAGHDTFTVNTVYTSNFNTYNEATGGVILAGENNAFIGMAGNVVDGNGIAAILGNGTTGAMVGGNGAVFNLAGVRLSDITVDAGQNNQTITTTQGDTSFQVGANGDTINGVGGDIFTVKTGYQNYNSYNDLSGGTIQAGANNALIGLSGSFSAANGISTISGNGFSGVAISGNTAGATLDFSHTGVSDATIRGGANNVTIITPGGNQTLTGGGTGDIFAFSNTAGQDIITDFRAGNATGHDVIQLNGPIAPQTFAGLLNNITDVGGNAVITLANGGTITLNGVTKASLTAADFNLTNVTVDPGPSTSDVARSINLSTGQNAQGVIQQANDSLDANWQITGAAAPQDAPNAYVVASNAADFGYGGWLWNDASSTWIAAAPNNPHGNGNMDATDSFTLTASDIAHISSAGGAFLADDSGTIYINGHALASAVDAWSSWNSFTIPTADLVVGTNTLSLVTDDADFEIEGVRVNASIQIGTTGYLTIGHGQSQDVTALINGLITPGTAGDTETVTSTSGDLVKNAQGAWIYTAPTGQTSDTATFTVTDEYGKSTTGSIAVTIDQGPKAANGSVVVGHNQNTYLNPLIYGLVTPGLTGDTETITAISGAHTWFGGGQMIYGSPASGSSTFSYTVTDQLGETATGQIAVTVDPGAKLASGALTVGLGQSLDVTSLINSLITKGLAGDTETISATSGNLVQNAAGAWIYTAPSSGTSDSITFKVTDQVGDVATGAIAVTLPPPVPVLPPAPLVVATASNQVNLWGYNNNVTAPVTPTTPSLLPGANITGPIFGNTTLTGTPNNITITAQGYNNTIIAGGGNDTINAGLSGAAVTVSNNAGNNIVQGSVGMTTVDLGNGNNTITLGGYHNAVQLGSGNNTVETGVGNATVQVGNGVNTITADGYFNTITAGNGDNIINTGAGYATVELGTGSNTVTASGSDNIITVTPAQSTGDDTVLLNGFNNTVTLGNANNTVTGSQSNLTLSTGNGNQTITAGGYDNLITVGNGNNVINAGQGMATVIAGSGTNTITASGIDNTITVAGGTSTIIAGESNAVVHLGSSSANVTLDGYNNWVEGGSSAVFVSGGADNTYELNSFGPTGGMTINSFSANNGDVLDLANVMSETDWNHATNTLSNYLSVTAQGNNTIIGINESGTGNSFVTAVTLQNMGPTSLDALQASHALTLF